MNVVNEEIVKKILTVAHPGAEITIKKWDLDRNAVKAGNNYSSVVCRLTIEYLKNDDTSEKRIFVKVPSANPAVYELSKRCPIFEKELIMYTDILPRMFAITGERFFPQCYMEGEKETLFLKDLSQSGYKMANRCEQLDFEHCYYALKCLAQFHGLSVKLRERDGLPDAVEKEILFDEQAVEKNLRDLMFSGLWKFYDNLDPSIQEKYSQQIKVFKDVSWEKIAEECPPTSDSFNVLNHGDFWTNNMIFKYNKLGILKKVKLLDFQMCRWNSPAMDLINFTVTCMRYDVYVEYFDLLMNVYLDTLNKVLGDSDCGTYTMKDLKNDMGKRYKLALMALTCMLPIALSDADKPVDMDEVMKDSDVGHALVNETYRQTRYMEVATKWFLHFAENGIFGFQVSGEKARIPTTKDRVC